MYKNYIEKIALTDYSDLARRMRAENVANLYDSGASQHAERIRRANKANQAKINASNKANSQRAIDGLKGIREDLAPKVKPAPNSTPKSKSLNIKRYGEPGQRFKIYKPDTKSGLAKLSTKSKIGLGAGALALGAGATAYGIYRNSKKNKEKTAYDIVVDAFEKI